MNKATVDTAHPVECDGSDEVVLPEGGSRAAESLADVRLATGKRRFGALSGKVDIGAEFFDPSPDDDLRAWECSA